MVSEARGDRFLADFNRLKLLAGNDPANLDASREIGDEVQALCKKIAWHVRGFERIEKASPLAFTDHIAPASISARREYEERWRNAVQMVADKDLMAFVRSLLEDMPEPAAKAADEKVAARGDELSAAIADWKQDANERARSLDQIIEFAADRLERDECGEFEWVSEGIEAWDELTTSGLKAADTLWRRRAMPHILIPSHVAKQYGKEGASLYRRLKDAGTAFACPSSEHLAQIAA